MIGSDVRRLTIRSAGLASALALVACNRAVAPLIEPKHSAVALTGGPNTSMVYLARTSDGVIAIDLGWWRSQRAVRQALRDLGSAPGDVTDVFLTHSHRDHVGAWRLIRASRFHLADPEVPLLLGDRRHGGWIPRLVERVKPSGLPAPNEIDLRPFSRDTTFAFGRDTLYAFVVPGHTVGSAAYLFRGVLFLGDAATHTPWGGFGPARRGYSDDAALGAASLAALWPRLPAGRVQYVCTAHARCRSYGDDLLRDIAR